MGKFKIVEGGHGNRSRWFIAKGRRVFRDRTVTVN